MFTQRLHTQTLLQHLPTEDIGANFVIKKLII